MSLSNHPHRQADEDEGSPPRGGAKPGGGKLPGENRKFSGSPPGVSPPEHLSLQNQNALTRLAGNSPAKKRQ